MSKSCDGRGDSSRPSPDLRPDCGISDIRTDPNGFDEPCWMSESVQSARSGVQTFSDGLVIRVGVALTRPRPLRSSRIRDRSCC